MSKVIYPVAIIDIGSNSVRLLTDYGNAKEKSVIVTRLAEGMVDGVLSEVSMVRTANAVVELFHKAVLNGAKSIFAFATAAVRNSVNGNEFISLVNAKTGVKVEVVSGETEAELASLGAIGKTGAVIDIGGASTEIIIKINGETLYSVSYPFGAVNLKETAKTPADAIECLRAKIKGVKIAFNGAFTAIGGTCLTLSAMAQNLTEYDAEKTHGYFLSKQKIEELFVELNGLSPEQISQKYPFAKARAGVIAYGVTILLAVVNAFNLDGVCASESDNLEGYLKYLTYEK